MSKLKLTVPEGYFERSMAKTMVEVSRIRRHRRTAKYQEDANLNKCVKTLQKIDIELKLREKKKVRSEYPQNPGPYQITGRHSNLADSFQEKHGTG